MSIFKIFKNYYSVILFLLILILGLGLTYYFFFYKDEPYKKEYDPKATYLEKLSLKPDYLREENIERIKGLSTMEYLRTRMLFHKFNSSNPENDAMEELERDFPGEKGRLLMNLLLALNLFEKEKKIIEGDENLDSYQKYVRILKKRKEIFGKNLEPTLFPVQESDLIQSFFLYSDRYLKRHPTDTIRSKKTHLEKARMEIYDTEYENLKSKEPFEKILELELKIQEREMSILSEEERRRKIDSIKRELLSR
ncbi:MAG: hypothetical protein KDK36_16105 [Leptospiraceae bacterium]|nr:hypothetical protein [Leptospiraceae bacterium]